MAIFDPAEQRMCVRIVYDGAAGAGKTTNLQQLCGLFATQRTTELYTPAALDGRTLYFDWVQIAAGVVCGFPLMCQLISVPGHLVLTPRRRHLLATADVVVYVCDSSAASIERARDGLAIVEEISRERGSPIPLLIQANKQDQVGALAASDLLKRLGQDDRPSIEAIATEGIGVVDTFVRAVRVVSRAMQDRSDQSAFRVEVRRADRAADVLAQLSDETLDPELAAEMVLEDALAAYVLAGLSDETETREEFLTPGRSENAAAPSRVASPRLPRVDVPIGFIWPAHTGRATLAQLEVSGGLDAKVIVNERGIVEHDAGVHVLLTSTAVRYDDPESARQALVRAARERTQLEQLLAPETVLVAQSASDGSCWIWTVVPKMPSVQAWLASKKGDAFSEVAPMLEGYGVALAIAVAASLRHGIVLDVDPRSFSVQNGRIRYTGELGASSKDQEELPRSVMSAIGTLAEIDVDVAAVLDAFEREFKRRLSHEELTRVTSTAAGKRLRDALDGRAPGGDA